MRTGFHGQGKACAELIFIGGGGGGGGGLGVGTIVKKGKAGSFFGLFWKVVS